jgi:FHS family L-fucose permease-like MFS transporter
MAMTGTPPPASAVAAGATAERNYTVPLAVLTTLFFMWGLITSLNDILIPHLKGIFTLSYVQVMLIQFCFFGAYLVMSYPSGYLVERLGYRAGIIIGLSTAGVGCLMFYPAASFASYPFFLGALFVLAAGITLLQVAANPYVAVLGKPETASSRLVLTQAFNSLGTTIGPFVGSILILSATGAAAAAAGDAARAAEEARTVQMPYIVLAAALFLIAVAFSQFKLPAISETSASAHTGDGPAPPSVWSYRHLVLGAVGIFVYVGGEVSIGSFLVNFMSRPEIGGLTEVTAGKYLSLYWGGAMVGRFIGAAVLRTLKPGYVLAFNAAVVTLLLAFAMLVGGQLAMWAVISIGFFNSIMFPTIFTLAIDGLGPRTGEGSGVLCMAIVGGAIVPVLQGFAADHIGILMSFIVPLVCYLYIVHYGLKGHVADRAPAR